MVVIHLSFRDEIRKRAGDLLFGTGKGTAEPLIDQLKRKPEKVEEEAAPPPEEVPKAALEARPPPKPRREYAISA